MDFILRILFSGLITFVPSDDGKELTVLLLNVDHAHHISDGTTLPDHKPLLLARAGNCSGVCPTRDADIARFLFSDQSTAVALDSLEAAVAGGGAWTLNGSDVGVRKGSAAAPELPALTLQQGARNTFIPTTAAEREDYSWLADLKQICGTPCNDLDPAVLASQPSGIVAARFRLRSGKVFTYSIARTGNDVQPVHFRRLDGRGGASPYSQAVAAWMGADIAISGEDVELVEAKFDGSAGRSMKLTPDANGRVEVAVLNLPPFAPPASPFTGTPGPGTHFEMFYELAQTPPARSARLVPYSGAADAGARYPEVTWQSVHPRSDVYSELLAALRLDVGRTISQPVLCPPSQFP